MIPLEEAYDRACRQLGDALVKIEVLTDQLTAVTAERDEAGAKIVELTTERETD